MMIRDAYFMEPLDKIVDFSARINIHVDGFPWPEISSAEMPGYGTGFGCDGHLPDGATQMIDQNQTITWTWSDTENAATCVFTLRPCLDDVCQ